MTTSLSWFYLMSGQWCFQKGHLNWAEKLLRRAATPHESAPSGALLYYGQLLSHQGRWEEAVGLLEKECQRPSARPVFHLFLAVAYFDTDEREKARETFEKVLAGDDQNRLAKSYLNLLDFVEAPSPNWEDFTPGKIVPDPGFQARLYIHLIRRLFRGVRGEDISKEERDELIKEGENLAKRFQKPSREFAGDIEDAEYELWDYRYDEAEKLARKAVDGEPNDPLGRAYLGYTLWKQHKYEESRQQLDQYERLLYYQAMGRLLEEDHIAVYALAASCSSLLRMGRIRPALRQAVILSELAPNAPFPNTDSLQAQSEVWAVVGERGRAIRVLMEFNRKEPELFARTLKEMIEYLKG